MSEHHTTIHKDGRTISIVTDDEGDQTVTATADDHADKNGSITAHTMPAGPPATLTTAQVNQPSPVVLHRHHEMDAGAAFFMGMIMGAFILWLLQREGRRRRRRPEPQVADVSQHDVAALARRTANLERIITDPATRTANEIEALR